MIDNYTDFKKKNISYNSGQGCIAPLSQQEKDDLKMRIMVAISSNLA